MTNVDQIRAISSLYESGPLPQVPSEALANMGRYFLEAGLEMVSGARMTADGGQTVEGVVNAIGRSLNEEGMTRGPYVTSGKAYSDGMGFWANTKPVK